MTIKEGIAKTINLKNVEMGQIFRLSYDKEGVYMRIREEDTTGSEKVFTLLHKR